jgi:Ca-activated chloride channel family protein
VPTSLEALSALSLPLWGDHRLAAPLWLAALFLLPLVAWLRARRPLPVLLIPHAAAWAAPRSASGRRWPARLAYASSLLLVLALARPQRVDDTRVIRGEGYDIVIAIDLSTSMFAEDNVLDGRRINRLDALKPVLEAFIRSRPSDRIGFVAFAGRAYTLAPLTHDHAWLARQVARLRIGLIEDGTALGDGLALSLARLQRSRSETEARAGAFVVLMTDGKNNRGQIPPEQAAALAKSRQVPVFTIGVGRDGIVPFPVFDDQGRRIGTTRATSDLDPAALRQIAAETGGRYFRAEDPDAANSAFAEIDRAKKISFDQTTRILATEFYAWPASASALLLLLAALPLLSPRHLVNH